MARAAARESVTIAGSPERVAVARAFAAAVLGRQHPAGETVVLLLSELVTNSVRHSASGLPGRTVTVTVLSDGEVTRVHVTDRSGATVPALRPGVSGAEGGGRGCTSWTPWPPAGDSSRMAITPTWFELRHR
jgi:anti-sigma regulatory factor (Ser/Thr protein kinase)